MLELGRPSSVRVVARSRRVAGPVRVCSSSRGQHGTHALRMAQAVGQLQRAHTLQVAAAAAGGSAPGPNGHSNGAAPGTNGHDHGHGGHGHSGHGSLADEMAAMSGSELADTLWGWVMARGYDPAVFSTMTAVVSRDTSRYDPPALISLLSAAAEVGHVDVGFTGDVAARLASPHVLSGVAPPDLAQLAWAVALAVGGAGPAAGEVRDAVDDLLAVVSRQAARKVADFPPDDLARLLAALAELRFRPATLLDAASPRLTDTLIPLAQLSPGGLAHVVWAYARLGSYKRRLFDAAHAELARRAGSLAPESLAHAAWAVGAVRGDDERHRALFDANLLHALAAAMRNQLDAPPPPPPADTAPVTPAPAHNPVPLPSLLTFLLSYAGLSHHDSALFDEAARYLAPRLAGAYPQDLVIAAYAFTRVKHKSPRLLTALGDAAIPVLGALDDEDLVYLATAGPELGGHHDGLMRAILSRALELAHAQEAGANGGAPLIRPASLLDLARCVAAVQHHDPEYYEAVSAQLLRAVNAGLNAQDLEAMTPLCGATDPSGLQK